MKTFLVACLLSLLTGFWATVSVFYRVCIAVILTGIVLLVINALFCELWNGVLVPGLNASIPGATLHSVPFWKDFILTWSAAALMLLAYWFTRHE